ncbi:MAG: hypothetical protein JWL92_652 [Candidatus Nomurabacteria bacterium]|nr:hypothetical protein [Candidatus Nomurabacteria bacterium]
MPKQWSVQERQKHFDQLNTMYLDENKTIGEIGRLLSVSDKTIYKRLLTLGIQTNRAQKKSYSNQQTAILIPTEYSDDLAELFGILLGDGSLSPTQVVITLGNKERSYAEYVKNLMQRVFNVAPKIAIRKLGYIDLFLGSVVVSRWLVSEGLVYNKVKSQIDVPPWVFTSKSFQRAFLRGFFDTDGSVYRLRYGIQLSFTNHSAPLLVSLQRMLNTLEYQASNVSSSKVYVTQKSAILRFFKEIAPKNQKHIDRFKEFLA